MKQKEKNLTSTICDYLNQEYVVDVINYLKSKGIRFHIFGGMIRDLYLGQKPKDIDICCDMPQVELTRLMNDFVLKAIDGDWMKPITSMTGKLGGFKMSYYGHDFDIWSIHGMYPFRDVDQPSLKDLHKSAQCSCNMITYNPWMKQLFHINNYFDLLDNKIIEEYPENCPPEFNIHHRKNYLLWKIGAAKDVRHCMFNADHHYTSRDISSIRFSLPDLKKGIVFHGDGHIVLWPVNLTYDPWAVDED